MRRGGLWWISGIYTFLIFCLLLFLSSSTIKRLRFSFRISTQVEEEGGWSPKTQTRSQTANSHIWMSFGKRWQWEASINSDVCQNNKEPFDLILLQIRSWNWIPRRLGSLFLWFSIKTRLANVTDLQTNQLSNVTAVGLKLNSSFFFFRCVYLSCSFWIILE